MSHALTFQDTSFDVIDRNGQPWLRSFQVGSALGYKNPSANMANLYDRNADEFTDSMTALVELDTNGGKQQVRIFSLRGCHLLGMLSKTKIAKTFRVWVLDILDKTVQIQENLLTVKDSGITLTLNTDPNAPYRRILVTECAGVTTLYELDRTIMMGTAQQVIEDLKKMGYVLLHKDRLISLLS